MKKALFTLFIFIPILSFAQLQVMGGLGFLIIKQKGIVLVPSTYDTTFLISTPVDRKLFTFGETITAFYALPLHNSLTGKFCMGPQLGLGFYYTRLKKSVDPKYAPPLYSSKFRMTFGPCRIPIEFAFRFGTLSNSLHSKLGMSLAAGVDMLYLHIPDEKAFAMLPCGTFAFVAGKTGIRFGIHFMQFQSVFESNAGDITRLTNSLKSFELVRVF
ncbi:MAG: hypothetical protein NT084_13985 [Bacteroidetes bacterium]|nr:hypothetical protein [Bacteroidota bacterium]